MRRVLSLWLCLAAVVTATAATAVPGGADTNVVSLAELQETVADQGCVVRSFRLEGTVCAAVPGRKIVALQDDSATILMELPALDTTVQAGNRLAIEADHCVLTRTRFGVRLGTEVVNNDGEHLAVLKSNQVFLAAGRQPLRLEWFNASTSSELSLQYEGPGIQRRAVPAAALCWHAPRQTEFQRGLHYAVYVQQPAQPVQPVGGWWLANAWHALPDFARLQPVAEGVATNFNVDYRSRDEYSALVFSGYLQVPKSGLYTFFLKSNDGSRLYVGDPSSRCKITVLAGASVPAAQPWNQVSGTSGFQWSELNGTVIFVSPEEEGTELELATAKGPVQVMVVEASSNTVSTLIHRPIEARGICETSLHGGTLMITPGWAQINVSSPMVATKGSSTNVILTSVEQIRRLTPEQARAGLAARITGVVIASTFDSLVLQDGSGGVFVHWHSDNIANWPHVGELWEIEGKTDPGDFSPVIFADSAKYLARVPMPQPIRPTWDQLMNGSLDAEYVELRGVVTALSSTEMKLLTPDGTVTVEGSRSRPLPQPPPSVSNGRSLVGCLVRMRGCFTADWNWDTRQVNGGRFDLYPATVEVEEAAPADPFSLPLTTAADLLTFNAQASALERTKVAGQVIHVRPGECFLQDEQTGVRVFAASLKSLHTGDLVEAVGFPKLGGPAPVLRDAQIRVTGHARLPEPVVLAETNLLDRSRDSTRVQVRGLLVSDTTHGDERVLELESGGRHFAAALQSDPRTWTTYAPGSLLQLTGVYASDEPELAGSALYPFEILLNNAAGIALLQQPSWWTVRRALAVVAVLVGTLGLAFIWITLLHRKVEQRSLQLQKEIEARQLVEQHRAVEQERTRVAQDLHDELGAGLTELGILGELGNNPGIPPEEKGQYLRQLSDMTRTLVSGLDEIVWVINPHYDSLASMATYFSFFADRFLKLGGVACRLRMAEHLPDHPVNSQIRHGVFLAFKEALNNVVRHAQATAVEIKIAAQGDELMISIRDNGRGIASENANPGSDGLTGMSRRLQRLGGSCRVDSHPGEGTTVEFRLPLKPPEPSELKQP